MGFWSWVGSSVAAAAATVAMCTPVGWVAAITLATAGLAGTAITAVDQINDHAKREAEKSKERIAAKIRYLVAVGDTEANVNLQRLVDLCTDVENKQALLATDNVPASEVASILRAIQDGIRELREGLVAWTSPLNPHKDKYDSVIGSLWGRVQRVGADHERLVCTSIIQTMESFHNGLNQAGQELLKLSKEENVELSDVGRDLLNRFEGRVPSEEEERNLEVEKLIKTADACLENAKNKVEESKKAVAGNNSSLAFSCQEDAEKDKATADACIIELIKKCKGLTANTPPRVFINLSGLYAKSAEYNNIVSNNIRPVLDIQIQADVNKQRRMGKVDFAYINDKSNLYLKQIKLHYEKYTDFKEDNPTIARYHAEYAKHYLAIVDEWMSAGTPDNTSLPSWFTTRSAINFAGYLGDRTGIVGLGGETASIKKRIEDYGSKVGAATQLAAIAHEERFKREMEFAYLVLGDRAEMTRQINVEIETAKRHQKEKLEEKEKEKARIAEEQTRVKAEEDKKKEKEDWAKAKAEQEQQEQKRESKAEELESSTEDDLDLPSVPTVYPKAVQEPETKAKAKELEPEKKKAEANDSLDLPSVPTGAVKGEKTEVEKEESSTEDDLDLPSVPTHQVPEHQDEKNLPLSEAMRNALSKSVKEDKAEKEAALALGVGEGIYAGIKKTKAEKQAEEILESIRVEKERRYRKEEIEERLKRSREAYKEWSELSVEAIKGRFKEYAEAFYRVYSSDDGKFKGSNENIKALDKLLNNDLGLYCVHSFLSTWSSLGLARKPQKPISDQEGILQRLDILYRKCLIALRENNQYTDKLLVLADKGKAAVTSHAFEVLEKAQKAKAIGISNTLKEAKWLNKKLPKECDAFTASESYIGKIRSELQKVNTKVEQLQNTLKLLGFEGFEAMDARTSFPLIKDSEKILEAGYNFPALLGLTPTSEVDPEYSQLFDMFIEDFHKDIKSYLSDPEEEERYPIAGISMRLNVIEDVERLSPLSSTSKIINKEGGDPSSMLDYEKIGHGSDSSLPADLDERFKKLSRFKGWVQLPPAKNITFPLELLAPVQDREREQRDTQEKMNRVSDSQSSFYGVSDSQPSFDGVSDSQPSFDGVSYSQPSFDGVRIAIDSKGRRRILSDDEEIKPDERLGWAEPRFVHIPCMDTGDVFNGTMGKKRRIFKVLVRVINTADIEVGILGFPIMPVEELIGTPKTGEFEVLVPSDTSINPEIVIRQKTGAPFCLTSITAHMQIEG